LAGVMPPMTTAGMLSSALARLTMSSGVVKAYCLTVDGS
jgi:hypothetical protein